IVFGSGYVTIPQMARAGILLNVVGAVVITLCVYYLGPWLLDMDLSAAPAWSLAR
ncbi:MAG: anion permease, partial [Myxococcales bacterium]|nr:anion permease [Myxococcales bacterium]